MKRLRHGLKPVAKIKWGWYKTALRKFTRLYAIEKQIKGLSAEQRYLIRLEKSQPILDDLKQWCEQSVTKTSKDSVLGKAIRYTLNQSVYLTSYLEEGELQIDNNAAETAHQTVCDWTQKLAVQSNTPWR